MFAGINSGVLSGYPSFEDVRNEMRDGKQNVIWAEDLPEPPASSVVSTIPVVPTAPAAPEVVVVAPDSQRRRSSGQ
jgi:hypothetical protein